MIYFISGHRDLSQEEFDKYYKPAIANAIGGDQRFSFVLAECRGADSMAQDYLKQILTPWDQKKVTIYHMLEKPRYLASEHFNTKGGFTSDISRDAAMTEASDRDIAFIIPGAWSSGTAQNILRRHEKIKREV